MGPIFGYRLDIHILNANESERMKKGILAFTRTSNDFAATFCDVPEASETEYFTVQS
jgi:hypothetical protein